jgi:exodeoxyribonuclease VII large subunit
MFIGSALPRLVRNAYVCRMAATDQAPLADNAPPYTVSELAFALKRTLEDAYGFVRLRGEISKVTRHASGHIYLTLKDDGAAIDGVVWRSAAQRLAHQPAQGLEVIVTGRVTTYPASSKYQIAIETLEPAGIGALLAQLERLKAKLAAEGLFAPERKRPLPALPAVVGVITSPTGAVIRDILHRIRDRWPCRVVVWPVVVQGETAAAQVMAAIQGFNAFAVTGPMPRPDVLIVARGGGSVEDLWAFNDEALARTAAASVIPLISAVGHETDTTLIDFVSDRRAPTPSAAAEMATPVLAELRASIADCQRRLSRVAARFLDERRHRLAAAVRGLPRPDDVLALATQRFNLSAERLSSALQRNAAVHERDLAAVGARLNPSLLERRRQSMVDQVAGIARRLRPAADRRLARAAEGLTALEKLRLTLDPNRPLQRGFARVHHAAGPLVRSADALTAGEGVRLVFKDGERAAVIDGDAPARATRRPAKTNANQGDLF